MALLAVLGLGCRREEIQVYRVEKEQTAKAEPASTHAAHARPSPSKLEWKTPAGWTEQPPSSMRVASFAIMGTEGQSADVAIIPLPGVTGRDLDMVNMWRGQAQLPAIEAGELTRLTTKILVGGLDAKLFDMAGKETPAGEKSPLRVLVAMLDREGTGWFFKMTGPDAVVEAQKPAFLEFLKSVAFRNSGADTTTAVGSAAAESASDGKPTWSVPAGWQEAAAGQFLVAKFTIAGEGNAQAAVNVSMSAGEGGGLVSNVNRWRRQLGLDDQSPDEILKAVTHLETSAGKAMAVEMAGTDAKSGQPARLVGAMVPQRGRAWFYKLMGDGEVVEAQKPTFLKFVESAKY